jgi:phosphoglucomutase
MEMYEKWLQDESFDISTREELEAIKDNEAEIRERFYADLEFGTGGLRGILGAGINRMNIYTVRKATQGLANFIAKQGGESKGVAIAYDSRRMSPEFANEAAVVLNANGIKAFVFETLRPTPMLSFAVRELGCIAGIVVTASHNPPEYNGYKVYWEDGAQVSSPKDVEIINEVKKVEFSDIKTMDLEKAKMQGLYIVIGKEIDDKYNETLKKLVVNPEVIMKQGNDVKIVYTPLHGTGNIPARRILKDVGFNNVYVVKEQELPDGEFPTVSYPNPEDIKAFELGIKLANQVDADLILATDPDADRLGVLVKDSAGEYIPLTGNMTGILIADYIISQKSIAGVMPTNGALIKTIVSTNMADSVANYYNVDLIEVLTGFKYIGEQIKIFEETGNRTYLFGFEESYGCLIGTHARDKDAIVATMAVCEVAAYYKSKGITLWEAMISLYEKYGYFKESLQSITLKGIEGIEKINEILEQLRKEIPQTVGQYKVVKARDYKNNTIRDMLTGSIEETGLPETNVLYYDLNDEAWFCVRPSGTEPKVKIYFGVKGSSMEDSNNKNNNLTEAVMSLINKML